MAIDKVVDSTKLNNALDYTADRIKLKTGLSANIPFDYYGETGFGAAIDAIPSASISIVDTVDPVSGGTIRTITGHVGTYETWTITYRDGTSEQKIVMVEEEEE